MKNAPTFHCHQGSLDTASTPEAFVQREKELGTGTLTVTDHGTMGACRQVYRLAKKNDLIPILGLEGYLRDDNCPILKKHGIEDVKEYMKYAHLTMHFLDQEAYEAAGRLLSDADERAERHGSESKPLFTWAQLEELGHYNVTMGSSCLVGVVGRHLLADRPDIAIEYYEKVRNLVKPGNFYVEVFPHKCDKNWVAGTFLTIEGEEKKLKFWPGKKFRIEVNGEIKEATATDLIPYFRKGTSKRVIRLIGRKDGNSWVELEPKMLLNVEVVEDYLANDCRPWCPDGDVQKGMNKFMFALASKYKDPILLSDDSHYAHKEEKIVQDVRLMAGGNSWRFYGTYERKSSEDMWAYFQELGIRPAQFERWIDNSIEWSQKFKDFSFKKKRSLPTSFFPEDTLKHTLALIKQHGRMDFNNKTMVARLKQEIDLLHNNGEIDLLPYFFTIEEACRFYRDNGRLTGPGRGSAAGLLLSYLLGITHVNPLDYQLSVERFLTEDRIKSGKLPDVDQDLSDRELLVNEHETLVRVAFDDGTEKILPKTTSVKTSQGVVSLEKAHELGLDIEEVLS